MYLGTGGGGGGGGGTYHPAYLTCTLQDLTVLILNGHIVSTKMIPLHLIPHAHYDIYIYDYHTEEEVELFNCTLLQWVCYICINLVPLNFNYTLMSRSRPSLVGQPLLLKQRERVWRMNLLLLVPVECNDIIKHVMFMTTKYAYSPELHIDLVGMEGVHSNKHCARAVASILVSHDFLLQPHW